MRRGMTANTKPWSILSMPTGANVGFGVGFGVLGNRLLNCEPYNRTSQQMERLEEEEGQGTMYVSQGRKFTKHISGKDEF